MDYRSNGPTLPKVGGGRGLIKHLDSFDPMAEAYTSVEFNSYPSGPGASLKQSMQVQNRRREEGSNFKLFVANIPANVSELGLKNIFLEYGQPLSTYISSKTGQSKTKWGFVEFKTMKEAQSAIYELNKAPPHHLIVQFARPEEEKAERKKRELEAAAILNQEVRPMIPSGSGLGRGKIPPLLGIPPKNLICAAAAPSSPSADAFSDNECGGGDVGYSSERFQQYRRNRVSDAATDVFANMSTMVHSNRRVSLGRGSYCPDDASDIRAFRHPFYRSIIEDRLKKLHNIASNYYTTKKNGTYYYNDEISQRDEGKCTKCGSNAVTACSACKTLYCSVKCMTDDYEKHRRVCPATQMVEEKRAIVENGNGNLSITKGNSPNAQQQSCPHNKNKARTPDQPTNPNKQPGDRRSYKGQKHVYARGSPPCPQSKFENKNSNVSHNSPSKIGGKGSEFLPKRYEEMEKRKIVDPPVPLGKFTEVEITVPEGPNVYWVQDVGRMKDQLSILKKLEAHCKNNQSTNFTPTVGHLYAGPYLDEWFRARVLQLEPKMRVHFVDYGNEETCERNALIELPKDLLNISPMAFKIHLADGTSSRHMGLSENTRLRIKPVSQDSAKDMWVVHVEGETYPEEDPIESSPLPFDSFEKVKIMYVSGPSDYWVQKNSTLKDFIEMTSHLGDCAAIRKRPVLGEIFVNKYSGDTWCRAKVISLKPLKVFYIDYGNEEQVNENELHPVPAAYKDVPPQAFHIKLSDGTSSKYFGLEALETLSVKEVVKLEDDTFIVQVEGENYNGISPNVVEKIQRKPKSSDRSVGGTNHVLFIAEDSEEIEFKVERVVSDEHLIGTIILPTASPNATRSGYLTNDQISNKLSSVKFTKRFNPKLSDAVCVQHDGKQKRGYTMGQWKSEWRIALVDYGVVLATPTSGGDLAPLPKESQLIPEAAVRCLLDTPILQGTKLEGKVLKCKPSDFEKGVLKVEVENLGAAKVMAWDPLIEEAGLASIQIPSGSKVILCSYHSAQALYVQSIKTEDLEMLGNLLQEVASHCAKASPLNRSPLTGEYLACKFNVDGNFYRAQVTKKIGDKYEVTFVDYGNTELVSTSDMRVLSPSLKTIPCCAIKVGLKGVPTTGFSPNAMTLLNQISASSSELFITYSNDDLSAVTLVWKTGMVINETLAEMAQPKWKKALAQGKDPSEGHVFMLSDLKYVDWPVKSKISVMILGDRGHNTKLAASTTLNYLNHISKTLSDQITEYANATSADDCYNPRINELCVAKYTEDGRWYRSVSTRTLMRSSEILFVDYGNMGEVSHSNIRRMPPDFISSPSILKCCKICGIPDNLNDKSKTELNTILAEGSTHQVVVVECCEANAIICIPNLRSKLVQLGLPPCPCTS